jgi:hypothetical protein
VLLSTVFSAWAFVFIWLLLVAVIEYGIAPFAGPDVACHGVCPTQL